MKSLILAAIFGLIISCSPRPPAKVVDSFLDLRKQVDNERGVVCYRFENREGISCVKLESK